MVIVNRAYSVSAIREGRASYHPMKLTRLTLGLVISILNEAGAT